MSFYHSLVHSLHSLLHLPFFPAIDERQKLVSGIDRCLDDVAGGKRQHDRSVINRSIQQKAERQKQAGERDFCPSERPLHSLRDDEHESFLRCGAYLCAHIQSDAAADAQVAQDQGQKRRERADAVHQRIDRADHVYEDRNQNHDDDGPDRNITPIHKKDDAYKRKVNHKHPEANRHSEVLEQGNKQGIIRAETERSNGRHHIDAEGKNQQACDKQQILKFEAKHEGMAPFKIVGSRIRCGTLFRASKKFARKSWLHFHSDPASFSTGAKEGILVMMERRTVRMNRGVIGSG